MSRVFLVVLALAIMSCHKEEHASKKLFRGPLTHFFKVASNVLKEEGIDMLGVRYDKAIAQNNPEQIQQTIKDFKVAQEAVVTKIKHTFKPKSQRLAFSQEDGHSVDVEEMYLADYKFPWNTATRLAYTVGFICTKESSADVTLVRFEFTDTDGDVIMTSNVVVYNSGEYGFEIRPEVEFFQFKEVNVFVYDVE